jgi:ankyrin repeat protein
MSKNREHQTLAEALRAGSLASVRRLVEAGANLHYQTDVGYDALIDAVHGRRVATDLDLLELLRYLIDHGVNLSGSSSYNESGLSVLSREGRFDAIGLLLDSGADDKPLRWSPLHRAVALGSARDVLHEIRSADDLEAGDRWERSPYLLALAAGSIEKARLLLDAGANPRAVGRCAAPAFFMPIITGHPATLAWLLEQPGTDVHQKDAFGGSGLIEAAQWDDLECVELLLAAGANVDHDHNGTALSHAESRPVALRLLAAGADPARADHRVVLCLGETDESCLADVTKPQFLQGAAPRFGTANPERIDEPFWHAMIRAGVSGYEGAHHFGTDAFELGHPVWCANRFGQSLTLLPDGRAVRIAGEHEDSHDPDFCIYNDVIVHGPDNRITVYGYPEDVFPPTDFHTATLLGDTILIIGSLGYASQRPVGVTPVYRLDLKTWRITAVPTTGLSPGRIFNHRADLVDGNRLRVSGGEVVTRDNGGEKIIDYRQVFYLDLATMCWRRE